MKNSPKHRRTPEEKEEMIRFLIETILLHAVKIDEGANGVIAKINMQSIEPEIRDQMLGELDVPDKHVVKLMKVYSPGTGKREYEAHEAVFNELTKHSDVAKIPRPYIFRDMPVKTEALQMALGLRYGLDRKMENVEIILMDLIEGDDLATIFYKEVVRTHPRLVHHRNRVDDYNFTDLQYIVPGVLGFNRPGGKGKNFADKAYEKESVMDNNAQLLYDYLKKVGFKIDRNFVKTLKRSLKLMHQHGIYHRDLHLRNVMRGSDGLPYIIDFGTTFVTGISEGVPYSDDDSGTEKQYLSDEVVLNICEKFESGEVSEIPDTLKPILDKDSVDENTSYQLRRFRNILEERELEITIDIIRNFISNTLAPVSNESRTQNEAYALLEISGWGSNNKKIVKKYIDSKIKNPAIDDEERELLQETAKNI